MTEMPKYYLVDVPHDLRTRVLDLCYRRLYHDALELLEQNGFNHYKLDDLINFYHWAPATLPSHVPDPEPSPDTPRDYPPPSPELLGDICKRLNELPPELAQQVDQDLKTMPIEYVANLLYKAGFPFMVNDLYEYRKSLFPPNAMVDGYTAGPPVLRREFAAPATEPSQPLQANAELPPASPAEAFSAPATAIELKPDVALPEINSPAPDPPAATENQGPNIEPALAASEPPADGERQPTADHDSPQEPVAGSTDDPDSDAPVPEPTPPEAPASSSEPPPPIIPKRRGKISGLPKAVRQRVNEMLDEGSTYENIIEWLDANGFPSINKVNLHNWHKAGFQDWLREQERLENQTAQREWLGDIITQSEPGNLHHCIYTLFASQIMDSLFGINTAKLKDGLAARPRDYIALMNGFRRMDEQLTLAPDFQEFLKRKRERKQGGKMPPDVAYAILRELRLNYLVERALECDEFKDRRKVKAS